MLKRLWVQLWFLVLMVIQIPIPISCFAQQIHTAGKRKLIIEIRPVYPTLARKVNLTGMVRLRVTVSAAGYPVNTEQLGGSPVLVKAATDAIFKAKWEPTSNETKELIQIRFDADQK
ncbi:MAG TPA: energy transducer TonB [Candidatus Sulfotelmatobacter sp.]|jgi:outer membrane biosynthesis protein TonB|nr:energy transducer TonB [Candidatus Sulfotelmatobacter sp.]